VCGRDRGVIASSSFGRLQCELGVCPVISHRPGSGFKAQNAGWFGVIT